jgi:MFS family permease
MALYGRILRTPNVAVLVVATTLTRLPFAINALALLLFVREATGSFAVAGATTGALALGGGIAGPFVARLVDRRGPRMLMPLACVYAAAILSVLALGEAAAPGFVLVAVAFLAGTAFPPTGAVLRSRWPELLGGDEDLVRGAYAFDSATIEISFVSGPLLVAGIVALSGPEAALLLSAALQVAGTALFVWRLPESEQRTDEAPAPTGLLGALGAPAIRMIALTTIPVGFCIGAVEVAIPAFSEAEGTRELSGVLLALWSLASGVGGLAFGVRAVRAGLVETYLAIALLFPLATLPLAAGSSPAVMAALVILSGLPIAPMIASRNELVAVVAPDGTGAEAFMWLMTSLVAGLSAGAAVAGTVVESEGWQGAVLVGAAVAALGAAVAILRRDSLRPALAPA